MLKISSDLKLPLDFVTQTCAILARRGAGKSYTASVLTEEMVENNLQVCVIDPIGVWHGLRTSADGKKEGLPVVIFGGDRGDLPLESTVGSLIADIVMEKKVSSVIDLSLLRKGEQDRFVCDFAERLYFKNRTPLHLIVDEADAFAPQKPLPGQQRMLGAMEDLIRRGRARGIGMTMVTQRSAVINKNLLSQIEVLIALQTTAPQDKAAVLSWVEAHGSEEECRIMMSALPCMPVGTAWVWSPAWLKCFKEVKIRQRRTFDSSATPKVGGRVIEPKKLAPVEIESLKLQMAAIVEKKKADDPRELKKKILTLEAEITQLKNAKPAPASKVKTVTKTVEVPIIPEKKVTKLLEKIESVDSLLQAINKGFISIAAIKADLAAGLSHCRNRPPLTDKTVLLAEPPKPKAPAPAMTRGHGDEREDHTLGDVKLDKCKRAILTVLAQYPEGKPRKTIAVLAGYANGGGSFNNSICNLRANGLIHDGHIMTISESGRAALGDFTPLPTGRELADHWMGQLDKCKKAIFGHLMEIYPNAITREELGAAIGYGSGGGSFNNSICRLRVLELIEGSKELKASAKLFGE